MSIKLEAGQTIKSREDLQKIDAPFVGVDSDRMYFMWTGDLGYAALTFTSDGEEYIPTPPYRVLHVTTDQKIPWVNPVENRPPLTFGEIQAIEDSDVEEEDIFLSYERLREAYTDLTECLGMEHTDPYHGLFRTITHFLWVSADVAEYMARSYPAEEGAKKNALWAFAQHLDKGTEDARGLWRAHNERFGDPEGDE